SANFDEGNYTATAPACPHPPTYLVFSHWSALGNLSVANATRANTTVTLSGNSTLIAHYLAQLTIHASPAADGSVELNSTGYRDGSSVEIPVGNYSLLAQPQPWAEFLRWSLLGGLTVAGGTLRVNATGVLGGIFQFAPVVRAGVSPPSCGPLEVNGSALASGSTTQWAVGSYPIASPNCTGSSELFEAWMVTGGVSVRSAESANATLTVTGNGTVLAEFVPGFLVRFAQVGGEGGVLRLNGTTEPNGSSALLAQGTYPLNATAMGSGFRLVSWRLSGQVSVSGGVLTVSGPGNVTALFGPVNGTGLGGGGGGYLSAWEYGVGIAVVLVGTGLLGWLLYRRRNRGATGKVAATK
ncbi:MAG: hypothetical protein L3K04_03955, partial [Thermoplasmata archaeon]|nr:hypothetical protein [Thermoplasmata archaeon]